MKMEPARRCEMIDTLRREGARGAWLMLLEAILVLAGPLARFERHGERPWSSATFSGARHSFRLSFDDPAAVAAGEAFIAALPDHEFVLRRGLVADATIAAVEHAPFGHPQMIVDAELLVLEEA